LGIECCKAKGGGLFSFNLLYNVDTSLEKTAFNATFEAAGYREKFGVFLLWFSGIAGRVASF